MIEPGLQRISRLLADVPLSWRAIHVAGTNGKGSICTYISRMLNVYNKSQYRRERGQRELRHGRFVSPHLIDRWDGITINQRPISKSDFDAIEAAVLARDKEQAIGASEFEIMTATAFEAFNKAEVDIGVVEVGMGGKLDATNIIGRPTEDGQPSDFRPPPFVTAISSIGLDHQGFLGDTIEEITMHKAGIIKPGVPVVCGGLNSEEVRALVAKVARENGSDMVDGEYMRAGGRHRMVPTVYEDSSPGELQLPLDGRKDQPTQRANTSVAYRATWTALQQLRRIPHPIEQLDDALDRLLVDMATSPSSHPIRGRQQRDVNISGLTGMDRTIFLDGAHNAQSATALAIEILPLRRAHQLQPFTWVLAASDGKDIKEILRPLLEPQDQIFAVEFAAVDGMPWVRPMRASAILDTVRELVPSIQRQSCHDFGSDVLGAIQAATRQSHQSPGHHLVATGSLYLIGQINRLLRDAWLRDHPEETDELNSWYS